MNSIRPLLTISILGIVGLVLYMKINETEPLVPADAMNWDMTGDLDIGNVDIGGTGEMGELEIGGASADLTSPAASTSASAYNSTPSAAPSFAAAPAFTADTKAVAPPAFVPDKTADLSPAVTPAELNIEVETPNSTAPVAENKPSESSKLPPLPALPAIAAGTAALTKGALSNSSPAANPAPQGFSAPSSTAPSFDTQEPVTPTESLETDAKTTAGQASLFSATRLAVQSALDRGELSQALLLLSDWYGDPSLSATEATEVEGLLSQLAGSVIYSTEHRLEPPYMVQAGEKLEGIAQKHNIPWQLLAKINGISNPDQLQPGQQLKVIRGPFSARIDLSERKMVLMLDRRYAGQFSLDVDPASSIEEGYWAVNQKLLTPGNVGMLNSAATASEDRSILLTSTNGGANQVTILRGPGPAADSAGRVIQLKGADVADVYDILSLGSQVMIRR